METPDSIPFVDDIINSYRHTAPYRVTPERQLWVAVAKQAIEDFTKGEETNMLNWIESDDFKFICKAVCIDHFSAAQHLKDIYCG